MGKNQTDQNKREAKQETTKQHTHTERRQNKQYVHYNSYYDRSSISSQDIILIFFGIFFT